MTFPMTDPTTVPQIRHALVRTHLSLAWMGPQFKSFADSLLYLYDVDSALYREILLSRMPTYCHEDNLALILKDRRMRRAPFETIESARLRALLAIDFWQLAGLPIGMLLAVQAFLAPSYPRVRIYTRGGDNGGVEASPFHASICYTLEANAIPRMLGLDGYEPLPLGKGGRRELSERIRNSGLYSRVKLGAGIWDYDSASNPGYAGRYWHYWIVAYPPWTTPKSYDSGWTYDGLGSSWGTNTYWGNLRTLRQIIREFSPHEGRMIAFIIVPTAGALNPLSNHADFPNGEWGWEGITTGDACTSARNAAFRYFFTTVGAE